VAEFFPYFHRPDAGGGKAYHPPAHMPYAVNVPNTAGVVPEMPRDAVVEVFATADGEGLHPRPPGPLALGVAAALRARLDQQALTVEAALTGDRRGRSRRWPPTR
jgi:alpha-galactosidase/6-phospho-beta-glucosidase family protein